MDSYTYELALSQISWLSHCSVVQPSGGIALKVTPAGENTARGIEEISISEVPKRYSAGLLLRKVLYFLLMQV